MTDARMGARDDLSMPSADSASAIFPCLFALVGIVALIWGGWTMAAFFASGPHAITADRTPFSTSWYAAHIFEAVTIAIAIPMAVYVVRGCIRAGRLTFDAKLCIAFLLVYWQDPLANAYQPAALYSSNFVNVATWCGYMPVSPDALCGKIVQPVLMGIPLYAFDFLGLVMLIQAIASAAKSRWRLGTAQTFVTIVLIAIVMNVLFMTPAITFDLWKFPALPLSLFGRDTRYPLSDLVAFSSFMTAVTSLRYFRDKQGRSLVERGLGGLSPRLRSAVSMLALIGFLQFFYALSSFYDVAAAPYSTYFAKEPAHILNGICDSGEWQACANRSQ